MNSKANHAAKTKAERQIKRVRQAIVGAVAIVAALVVALGLYYSTATPSGEFTAGKDFRVVEGAPMSRPGEPITVQEFFSYGCVHCRNFDPLIEQWQQTLADDVQFERVPATFSPAWNLLAQSYYALQQTGALEQNHTRMFRAIHDNGRQFLTIDQVADFVDGHGITRAAFLDAANGPAVAERLRQADRTQRALVLSGVPSLVVAGRYVVGMNAGRKGALEIVDHLVALERSGAGPAATGSEAPAATSN